MSAERVLDSSVAAMLVVRVTQSTTGTVVLERLPRAAGATRWFRCTGVDSLRTVLGILSPASRVSFYLNNRIAEHTVDGELRESMARLLADEGAIVLGTVGADGIEMDIDYPSSLSEAMDVISLAGSASRVFLGAFPAADDDGVAAVTVLVPDPDGTVRREPH